MKWRMLNAPLWFLSFGLFISHFSLAHDSTMKLEVVSSDLPELQWILPVNSNGPVLSKKKEPIVGSSSYFVTLNGKYIPGKGVKKVLIYYDHRLDLGPEGEFSIEVEIDSETQPFKIRGIDGSGKLYNYEANLSLPESTKLTETDLESEDFHQFGVNAGLATSAIQYQEPARSIFLNELGGGLRGSVRYSFLSKKLDLVLSDLTLIFPVFNGNSAISPAGLFLASLGLKYSLPRILKTINLSTLLGIHFWKTFVSGNTYGINYIMGPQLSLFFDHDPSRPGGYFGRIQLILYGNPDGSLNPSNREIAFGVGYTVSRWKGKPLSVFADVSQFHDQLPDLINSANVVNFSLGVLLTLQ